MPSVLGSITNMKVQTFWNKAFLAALTRLPADEAKVEADKATALCIERWNKANKKYVAPLKLWKDQDLSEASS